MKYMQSQLTLLKATFDEKRSCRREAARRFVSLNISLSHSRSLNVIRNVSPY